MSFVLHSGTTIVNHSKTENDRAVANAMEILARDIAKRFSPSGEPVNRIELTNGSAGGPETFRIEVRDAMTVFAEDALGFIYGLLYVSEQFLDIKPFWFWMDQVIEVWPRREIVEGT